MTSTTIEAPTIAVRMSTEYLEIPGALGLGNPNLVW
jgi:hypothetical protein